MPYTLMKGLVWVLLAVLLGIVIGWFLRSVAAQRQVKRARSEQVDNAELERLRGRVANLEPIVAERDMLKAEVEATRDTDGVRGIASVGRGDEPAVAAAAHSPPVVAREAGSAPSTPSTPDVSEAAAVLGRPVVLDDLRVVEGIGPKIQQLCHGIGIRTWFDLSTTEVSLLRTMLADAGSRFSAHDPTTWPRQAGLLAAGRWQEFVELTDELDGGRGLSTESVQFVLNGQQVMVAPEGSLLDALREDLGVRSVKDGCSPQGQCGCCTVWVDGQPRVSCVTPVARVRGREVTTVEGLPDAARWAASFSEHGGSQCGFCSPGIIMRGAALEPGRRTSREAVGHAMLAHLCRCTGWHPIVDAIVSIAEVDVRDRGETSTAAAERRAQLEGGVLQTVGPQVALGLGGFADDTAPADALVAVRGDHGDWVVGASLVEARAASGKVQGRRTTAPLTWPLEPPEGDWVRTLQTTWVEPAYLEPDASWCEPGGTPMSLHGNGGAFGGKESDELGAVARRLADEHDRPVRVLSTREDVVRYGAKRPPIAAGLRSDGTAVMNVARTPGVVDAVLAVAPSFEVVEFDVAGPPTSIALRGAGWVEAMVLLASLQPGPSFVVTSPSGATASARVDDDGSIQVTVDCGAVLDAVVLHSYCVGAAHMALGWVTSEGLSVDEVGEPHDLTIRSFGVLRAVDTPPIEVELVASDAEPVNGSDAVFAAVATAAWHRSGWAPRWPSTW